MVNNSKATKGRGYICKDCGSRNSRHTVADCRDRGGEQARMLMNGQKVQAR